MEIHPVDILISLINVVVLFALLRLILWKHINRYLSDRAAGIQKERDTAAEHRKNAEALELEYTRKIEDFEEQGLAIIQESRLRAKEEYDKILSDARTAANKLISDAEFRIELDRNQALKEAHADVTQLATEMATRILEREISAADNEHAVDAFFRDL